MEKHEIPHSNRHKQASAVRKLLEVNTEAGQTQTTTTLKNEGSSSASPSTDFFTPVSRQSSAFNHDGLQPNEIPPPPMESIATTTAAETPTLWTKDSAKSQTDKDHTPLPALRRPGKDRLHEEPCNPNSQGGITSQGLWGSKPDEKFEFKTTESSTPPVPSFRSTQASEKDSSGSTP